MDHLQEVLDLAIVFTQPPPGLPPEILARVAIQCDALGLSHTGEVFTDPLTEAEREDLRWYLEEYWQWPYLEFAERGKRVEALLDEVGSRFYQALFGSREAHNIIQAWQRQGNAQHRISIVSEIASVLRLPWELLADPQGFLVLHADHPVSMVRRLPKGEQASFTTPFQLPLRVLLVTARPEDAGFVDPRNISREMVDELQGQTETIELEFLRPPTFAALSARLKNTDRPIHVLHFDGHGGLDQKMQQGVLLFETNAGKQSPVKARDLAKILSTSGVRLAVLTACQSAMNTEDDAFSSVSTQLINNGVDAVIAMRSSILVTSAALYAEAFYRALASGLPMSIAQEQARFALHKDPHRHLFSHPQDEEAMPVTLADWWVPHFYQQRPLVLHATTIPPTRLPQPPRMLPRFNDAMPKKPRYHFSGRAWELLQIERALLRKRLVILSGFGGIGKTALACEAANWLTRTGLYTSACFISFEHGGGASLLLNTLGRFLDVYDAHDSSTDPASALARLGPILATNPTLVIADNLESLLPPDEASLEQEELRQVWDVLLELLRLGAGILLTSRSTTFGDERFVEGVNGARLPLAGLTPDDAYTLASSLLTRLGIDRRGVPSEELRHVLRLLDYHPLSIQLVLPALRSLSLLQIQMEFASLLTRFQDDGEHGHNQSLIASLEYSLNRLSQEQRTLLSRLAFFEEGVMEDNLLAITEIPEEIWADLRLALEQTALLTVERLKGVTSPFLHFHPVLIPYLRRGQPPTDAEAILKRYTLHYYIASHDYYQQDSHDPQRVRAIVWREMSNLLHALKIMMLQEMVEGIVGLRKGIVDMADNIDRFLVFFGLHHAHRTMQDGLAQTRASWQQQFGERLTREEFLFEKSQGEEECQTGQLPAAITRFLRLLARIEAQPEGTPYGPNSFEHAATLKALGTCFENSGDYSAAEQWYRKAISVPERLFKQDHQESHYLSLQSTLQQGLGTVWYQKTTPIIERLFKQDHQESHYLSFQVTLFRSLGTVLYKQGQYAEAKALLEQIMQVAQQIGDLREQAAIQESLGAIALVMDAYSEAQHHYLQALPIYQKLGESIAEAGIWHELGRVAQAQKGWQEAERCYRESLALKERVGDLADAAITCNELGQVAHFTHRFEEAIGWFRQAVKLYEQTDKTSDKYAACLSNLAVELVDEVERGCAQNVTAQLAEAQLFAEQALVINEKRKNPTIWMRYKALRRIATMRGQTELAQSYGRREREAYAAFPGYRAHIERLLGAFLPGFAAAQDDLEIRSQIEEGLPILEASDWHISTPLRRIWAGERDWHSLVEGLRNYEALLILRVLETLAVRDANATISLRSSDEIIAALPSSVQVALQHADPDAIINAVAELPPTEQQWVLSALQVLQELMEAHKKGLADTS